MGHYMDGVEWLCSTCVDAPVYRDGLCRVHWREKMNLSEEELLTLERKWREIKIVPSAGKVQPIIVKKAPLASWLSFKEEIPKDSLALAEYWKPYYSALFCGFACQDLWVEPVHLALCAMRTVDPEFRISQVKSKWSELRIYFDSNQEDTFVLNLIVDWAEKACRELLAQQS